MMMAENWIGDNDRITTFHGSGIRGGLRLQNTFNAPVFYDKIHPERT
jgi:hypothetical protein